MFRIGTLTFFLFVILSQRTTERNQNPTQADYEAARNPVTEIGTRVQYASSIPPLASEQKVPAEPALAARYIRVLVQVEAHEACDWFLTVRDQNHRVIQTMTRKDFK